MPGYTVVLPRTRQPKTREAFLMRPAGIFGIILIVLGILALVYRGIGFTERETHDLGPLEVTTEEEHSFPIAPVLGGLAIAGGIALLFVGSRRRVD